MGIKTCMKIGINNKFNHIGFSGGLKQNLQLGEKVLRNFKSQYPYFYSNTFVKLRVGEHTDNPKYFSLIKNLVNMCNRCNAGVKANRLLFLSNLKNGKLDYNFMKRILKDENYANCGEQALLLKNEFDLKTVPDIIRMKISGIGSDKPRFMHDFIVLGMEDGKKNVNSSRPKTWSNRAVIVDSWTNIVMPAKEALEYFKSKAKLNPKVEEYYYEWVKS